MSGDPLFDASIFEDASPDPETVELLREDEPDEDSLYEDSIYHERQIRWVGVPGKMYRASWDEVHAFPGNPFDPEKIAAIREVIREGHSSGDKAVLYAPPALTSRVDLTDVAESQRAERDGELFESYGMSRPYTTGDDELDEYLVDPEEYVLGQVIDWDDEDEKRAVHAEMTARAAEALASGDGDLGSVSVQLRDGNHRAFAAQLEGESYVWVIVNDYPPGEGGVDPEDLE